jgi:hypothetical protein
MVLKGRVPPEFRINDSGKTETGTGDRCKDLRFNDFHKITVPRKMERLLLS